MRLDAIGEKIHVHKDFEGGYEHYLNEDYGLAIAAFSTALLKNSRDYESKFYLGAALLKKYGVQRLDEAKKHMLQAISENPNPKSGYRLKMASLLEEVAQSGVIMASEASYERGIHSLQEKKYDDATRHFERAILLNPKSAESYEGLGFIGKKLGLKNKVKDNYLKALDIYKEKMNMDKIMSISLILKENNIEH